MSKHFRIGTYALYERIGHINFGARAAMLYPRGGKAQRSAGAVG